jgi:hypothetical protein
MSMQARFRDRTNYTVGELSFDMPGAPGKLVLAAVGEDKADALMKAAAMADRIASDPVISALLPPQAKLAILAAKKLGAAAQAGAPILKALWRSIKGPGKKRLATVLVREAERRDAVADVAGELGISWKQAAAFAVNPFIAAQYVIGKKGVKAAARRLAPGRKRRTETVSTNRYAAPTTRNTRVTAPSQQQQQQYGDPYAQQQYGDPYAQQQYAQPYPQQFAPQYAPPAWDGYDPFQADRDAWRAPWPPPQDPTSAFDDADAASQAYDDAYGDEGVYGDDDDDDGGV